MNVLIASTKYGVYVPNCKITQELQHCGKQATANVPPWHAEKAHYTT
jgi:hypothetical protein